MADITQVPTEQLMRMYQTQTTPERAPLQITVHPSDAQGKPDISSISTEELLRMYQPDGQQPSVTSDAVKSLGSGVMRGVAGLIGLPEQLAGYGAYAIDKGVQAVGHAIGQDLPRPTGEPMFSLPTTEGTTKFIEKNITGPLHEPQTRAGRYANTVGEFLPGAALGPGSVVGNAVRYAVLPGITSEFAGERTEGTPYESAARFGAAVGSGFGAAALTRPNNVGRIVSRATDGVTDAHLNAAEALFQEARQANIPITRAEALQHVTNGGTDLANWQRVVEGSGQLRDFFSTRPETNTAAARQTFETITPQAAQPAQIGPEASTAATGTLDQVRGTINNASRPFYDAAMRQSVSPQEYATFANNPVWIEGVRRARNDPFIGPTLQGLPDNSLVVIDAVKKQLDETGRNLRDPLSGTARNNYAASLVDQGRDRVVSAADRATGSTPGNAGSYETARYIQSESRRRFLEPLLNGPLGKIAKAQTTQAAINALFPRNPIPGSAAEVSGAVTALANRNPWAARQLVRAHAESSFNRATARLTTGLNEYGGAKFAALIRGNPQQAENLEAAVRALPNGNNVWDGFDRFLNILEAQGQRQRPNSATAFNQEMQADLKRGSALGDTATLASGVGIKWPQKIKDTIERWRLGRNVEQLAYLLTDPAAGREFARLVNLPAGSAQAAALVGRIIALTYQARAERTPAVNGNTK